MIKLTVLLPEEIMGGMGDKHTIQSLADKHVVDVELIQQQLEMGIDVEMEHTDDRDVSSSIAMDHLAEDPQYYTHLKKCHSDH